MGDYEPIILPLDLEDEPAPPPPIRGPIRPPASPKDKDYKPRKLDEKKHRVFNSCSSPGSNPYKKRKTEEPKPRENSRDHRTKRHGTSSPHGGRNLTPISRGRVHYDSESDYSEPADTSRWLTTSAVACFLIFVVIVGVFVTFYLQSLKIINVLPFEV